MTRRRDETGAVAVMVAVFALVMFVLAALIVDLGQARDTRRQAQNAADASALAGANVLYPSATCTSPAGTKPPCFIDAVDAVLDYASKNFDVVTSEWTAAKCADPGRPAAYYVPPSGSPCISFDSATKPIKVRVRIPQRAVTLGFGSLTGEKRVQVGAVARATLNVGKPISCGLCFLGPVDGRNADFRVTGADASIMVNGDLGMGPNSYWTAEGAIGVTGSVSGGNFDPAWSVALPFGDPLASLVLPLDQSGLGLKSDPCEDGPGIYGDAAIPKTTCTLKPGLYVVTGTWGLKNNSKLVGTGVTLYVRTGGMLNFKNGEVAISAPTTGTRANLAIIYDRTNASPLSLQGNGETSITGVVYAPASQLDFNGNSCFGFRRGPVVVMGVEKANGNKSCTNVLDAVGASIPSPPSEPNLDQ